MHIVLSLQILSSPDCKAPLVLFTEKGKIDRQTDIVQLLTSSLQRVTVAFIHLNNSFCTNLFDLARSLLDEPRKAEISSLPWSCSVLRYVNITALAKEQKARRLKLNVQQASTTVSEETVWSNLCSLAMRQLISQAQYILHYSSYCCVDLHTAP